MMLTAPKVFMFLVLLCIGAQGYKYTPLKTFAKKKNFSMERLHANNGQHQLSKAVFSGIVAALVTVGPTTLTVFSPQIFTQSAVADFRAQQKRTYFRFVPKLIIGRDFFKTDLKAAIDNEKWDVVKNVFEEYVTKYNPNDPSQVDATDSYVNDKYLRPMTVFAGSFAERATSDKTRALLEKKEEFAAAMGDLEGCIKDRKGQGFFAPDIKMPTGAARKTQALDAWARGKAALNEYIALANSGLMFELNKIDPL